MRWTSKSFTIVQRQNFGTRDINRWQHTRDRESTICGSFPPAFQAALQVSQVYQTMKITVLSRMIPFSDFAVVERLVVDAVKYNFLQLKIDHLKGIVQFGSQDLESDKIRNHLTILAKRLNKARILIQLPSVERVPRATVHSPVLLEVIEKEHRKLLARKVLIERRKEEQERQMLEIEREEESKRLKQQRITEEAEQKRLASEYTKREELRIRREIEEKELEEAHALLQEAERRKGKKGKKTAIEGEKVTKQTLIEQALNEQLKERQEMERKLQKLAKTMDYLERAKREEETHLIEAAYQKHLVDDEIFFEQQQQQAIEQSRQQHAADLVEKNRLIRMLNEKNIFQNQVVGRRQGEFERLKREREERLAELRAIRTQEREMRRKMEYYRRQEEARLIKLKEEEEAHKREEEERKRKQDAERKAKLDEIAEKQKQREKELEEKERLRKEALIKEEPRVVKSSEPNATKFVPRALRKGAESAVIESDNDSWRRPDRQVHIDDKRSLYSDDGKQSFSPFHGSSNRDVLPPPRQREADASLAKERYAPPPRKYEPPTRQTQGKYEPPVSGRRDQFESLRGREAQRPKYGGFGNTNRDDRDRWGGGSERERHRDEDRSGGTDNWRRPSKPDLPPPRHIEEQAA